MTFDEGYVRYRELAMKIAKRLRPAIPRTVTSGELKQFAMYGLWDAMKGEFRDDRTFSNYVAQRINGAVRDWSKRATGYSRNGPVFINISALGHDFDIEDESYNDQFDWAGFDELAAKLRADQREVIVMLRQGLTKAEIASQLGVPWQTVQYRFEGARRALLKLYAGDMQ